MNPSIQTSSKQYGIIDSNEAYYFSYSSSVHNKEMTLMIVCLVANKRGYMISYSCVSELYRRLKGIADTMIQSLSIISSVEDSVGITMTITI